MDERDRRAYVERYQGRLERHGYAPETLGWSGRGRQSTRFAVLAADALADPESSVLDVGCGFADLYDFLRERGWRGRYAGIDVVPGLLEVARERRPELDLRLIDVTADEHEDLETFDYAVASGVMNARLEAGDNRRHILTALTHMLAHVRRAVCADFLGTWVDFQKPEAWHTDPAWLLDAARSLSRRLVLRLDYMPYEFALILYRDQEISERNVFAAHEDQDRHR